MFGHPLTLGAVAESMYAEKLATAERVRRQRRIVRAEPPRRPPFRLHAGTHQADLGEWLDRVAVAIETSAGVETAQRQEAMHTIVEHLVGAAADAGLHLGLQPKSGEPAVVIMRTLARLAERTVGASVPVSRWRRSRLEQATAVLNGTSARVAGALDGWAA